MCYKCFRDPVTSEPVMRKKEKKALYQEGEMCPHCVGDAGVLLKGRDSLVLECAACKLNPYTGKPLGSFYASKKVEKVDRIGETCGGCKGASLIQSIDDPEAQLWCVGCDSKVARFLYRDSDGKVLYSTPEVKQSSKVSVYNPNDRAGKTCPSHCGTRLIIDDEDPTVVNCMKCFIFGSRYDDTSMIKMDKEMVASILDKVADAMQADDDEAAQYEAMWGVHSNGMGGSGNRHYSSSSNYTPYEIDIVKTCENASPFDPWIRPMKWLTAANFPELVAA
jgi:hypothetical protein